MKFFLKKKFFAEVLAGFVMFFVFTGFHMMMDPARSSQIFWNSVFTSVVLFIILSIPWYITAHSSITESRKQLKEMRGGVEFLKKQRAEFLQDEAKLKEIDGKIFKAVSLYNQQIEITDRALGEYPNRLFVEWVFNYRRPRDLNPGI